MKDKNKLIYFTTICVVIIVYLVIYIFGITIRKSLLSENEGYENSIPSQPINNILSIIEYYHNQNKTLFEYYYDKENYIDLHNQFPTPDEIGMKFVGDKYTHDFKLLFNTKAINVGYVITAIKTDDSDLEEEWSKMYLESDGVGVLNCFRLNGKVKTFNEYPSYFGNNKEKILYQGFVTPEEARRGYKDFTFRMWVSEDLKVFNDEYLSRNFKTRIRVYAQR